MPRMALDSLKDGMVLSRDVARRDGTVLVPAGAVLNRGHRALLAAQGVPAVEVTPESAGLAELLFGDEAQPDKPAKPAAGYAGPAADVVQTRLVRLARMFAEYKSDPLMREVCRLAIKCAKEGLIGV